MVQILRHELKKQGNETVLFLYLDQSHTEFARELGSLDDNTKGDLDKSVNSYIRSKLPNLKQATVKIMVGGLLVTSFAFSPAVGGLFGGGDDNRAHAAEVDQEYKGFADISPNRESAPAIEALVKKGIISNNPDKFNPREDISRQHAAVMFVRALKLPTDNVTDPGFKDVPTTHPYYKEIAAATAEGLFQKADSFNPNGNFTRGQSASVIVNAYDLEGDTTTPFTDLVGSGHEEKIGIMYNLGLAKGTSGTTFNPNDNVKREQFAMLLHRTIEAQDDDVVVPPPDVAVSAVNTITTTTVDVTFAAPATDVLGATVEVKDAAGNIIEVQPIDISAGDTSASFDFKTAVAANALTGVWTVGGKEFSFTAIKQLSDITTTAAGVNQVAFLSALNAAGIDNVNQDLLNTYQARIVAANPAPNSLGDIQDIIDKANKENLTTEQKATMVKAVADATTQVQLLNALQANFNHVNPDWIVEYAGASVTVTGGTDTLMGLDDANYAGKPNAASIEGIQAAIDAVNHTHGLAAYNTAFASLNSTDIAKAKTIINTYMDDDTTVAVSPKDFYLDSISVLEAVAKVNTATTNNALKSALVSLDELENSLVTKYAGTTYAGQVSDNLDMKTVSDSQLAKYRAGIAAETSITKKNTASDIQRIVNTANLAAETEAAVAVGNVTATTTNVELKNLLTTLADRSELGSKAFDGDNINDSLLDEYRTALVAAGDKDSAGDISTIIVGVNNPGTALNAIKDAGTDTAPELLAGLKNDTLNFKNVVDANSAAYFAELGSIQSKIDTTNATTTAKSLTDVKLVIDAVNAKVAVNTATTDTAVRSALTDFALVSPDAPSSTTYLNLSSTAKAEVAGLVLAAKPTAGYTNVAALATAVGDQITAHAGLISGVNGATSIVTADTALDNLNYDPYKSLSSAKQVEVAEKFLAAFPKNTEGEKVNYTTLTAIKADIDKAIASAQ